MASTAVKMLTVLRPKGSYLSTILGTAPIALWPLSETSGTSAVDVVGGYNGTYTNATLNATTFPDGTAAPSFNGTTSNVNIYSAGFASAFNTAVGSAMIWVKQTADQQDANERQLFAIGADGNNVVRAHRLNTTLRINYYANAVYKFASTTNSNTTWIQVVATWNTANDRLRWYVNGTQIGSDTTGLGAWSGALSNSRCFIGATTLNTSVFPGNLKYFGVWNRELTAPEVANLAPAAFQV